MARDTDIKERATDSRIPPPCDPFPTYQVPYTRDTVESENQNPFIHFRRVADSQISSISNALPAFFGIHPKQAENHRRVSPSENSTNARIEKLEQELSPPSTFIEYQLSKILGVSRSEMEGFRKMQEQELEEMRMEYENWLKDEVGKLRKTMQDSADRLHADSQPHTELDLYDRFSPTMSTSQVQQHHVASDDAIRSSSRTETTRENTEANSEDLVRDTKPEAENLDPVRNEAQALGWWLQNEYSPLRLRRPSPNKEQSIDVSSRLDWEAAFNDLLESSIVYQQGSASDSQTEEAGWSENLLNTCGAARLVDDGMGIISQLKADFSDWGMQTFGIPDFQTNDNERLPWITQLDRFLAQNWRQVWDQLAMTDDQERSDTGLHEQNSCSSASRDASEISPFRASHAHNQDSSHRVSNEVSENARLDGAWTSSNATTEYHLSSQNQAQPSVLSTLTTTRTRTLADGTVETKRVLKTRFADGTEESDESVEVFPARPERREVSHPVPSDKRQGLESEVASPPSNARETSHQTGKGWFWN